MSHSLTQPGTDDMTPTRTCPNCLEGGALHPAGYSVASVPQHSCLLMRTRAEALAFPRGHIELWRCALCGFIFNRCFDPASQRFSETYEETQGFSPRFNRFAESLARRLIARHDVRGKRVLDIGCGKGEFLAALCALGGNEGIGIDPAYVPARHPADASVNVRFLRELYAPVHADIEADFICCRHTLEHIAAPHEFVRAIHQTIAHRPDVRLFIEVPDVTRIAREGAFWDVYYEHCSYFAPASLIRLMTSVGFEVEQISRDFDDQYLLLTARPAPVVSPTHGADIESLAELNDLAAALPGIIGAQIEGWRARIRAIRGANAAARIVLWGSGSKGVAFLTTLGLTDDIDCVVDINPHKQDKFMPGTGHDIVGPLSLTERRPTHVIVMNPVYLDEIRAQLHALGVDAELLAVGARAGG